ncbi:MAG: LysM peptidoglycan-binding domain-containing protein [Acidimicrobiaceae bacterium]|jgi:LysM repeat protein|nr:LysM peptidoglycan-binding domain-containing protein [Acidimicrobiaceae bacterium]MBP6486584.1 LysM peptidoglycan-binding domain-containing protein [Ilumatobacteraceae bacterium]
MPLFSLDRSPSLVDRPYSPQRAMRLAGLAGAGSLLAAVSIMVSGGGSSASGVPPTEPTSAAAHVAGSVGSSAPSTVTAATPTTTAATTTAATTTIVAATPCTNTYTVVSGDYWTLIAAEASVSVEVLYAANGATADTALFPEQSVCLPDGVTVVVPTTQATTQATTSVTTPASTQRAASTATAAAPAPVATVPDSSSHSSG